MYEVFLNERKIIITQTLKIPKFKEAVITDNLTTKKDVKNWFLQFTGNEAKTGILTHAFPEKFWKEKFLPAFRLVPAAGGVVIRNEKLMFIYRNGKWDLPKGKIDKNESEEAAALREVQEECGINDHKIIKSLPTTYHIFQSPFKETLGQWILKETYWFEMNYLGKENGTPEIEEDITEIRWFAKDELDLVLKNTYDNLKSLILLYKD